MKRNATTLMGAWVCALAAGLIATSAWAAPYAVGNLVEDFGVNPGSSVTPNNNEQWVPTTPGVAAVSDHSVERFGANYYVNPGYGGHVMDMVSMYSTIDQNTLYVAFVTGLPLSGYTDSNDQYFMGDVFINFGARHLPGSEPYVGYNPTQNTHYDSYRGRDWDLAFGLNAATGANAVSSHLDAYRNFDVEDTPVGVPGFFTGPWTRTAGKPGDIVGPVQFAYRQDLWSGLNAHTNATNQYHVYEFAYELDTASLNQLFAGNMQYNVFATMNCGNDFLYLSADGDNITNTVIPVPPAAGLILLGMAGLGLRRKFARKA